MGYKLVWSDEFDYTGAPDPAKWNFEVGGHGWGNNELQYYTDGANAWVKGGKLIIEARAEKYEDREVTSARLTTKHKGDWLYGKVEVRAKIPSLLGTWPAIWMLPTDWEYGGWPDSGEIDIMEHVAYEPEKIYTTVHTGAFNHMLRTHIGEGRVLPGASEGFHDYVIEWTEDVILFYVDGGLQFTYRPADHTKEITHKEWPFDKRFHLLINLAFGGNWGGAKGTQPEGLPARFEVESVKVWQKE
ncbi:MAG: glycoside hydrolase family 16 protein [Defluviitaleaceae bacterium]|nr:glycoside hydrolase family 16 protein [Defluviitaleaceae bacterium]